MKTILRDSQRFLSLGCLIRWPEGPRSARNGRSEEKRNENFWGCSLILFFGTAFFKKSPTFRSGTLLILDLNIAINLHQ